MNTKPFKFKEFTVHQDKCAMKIGTDGVLLGAWTSIDRHPNSILDIGTGTGIIALQLAQRSAAETIDALEIEGNAYEQAVGNFENSNWADRLFCYHVSLQLFTKEIEYSYDLIVSNPPFYNDEFKTEDHARNKARFTSSLSFKELVFSASKLLSKEGTFSVIVPFKEEKKIIDLASKVDLHPTRICRVKGNTTSKTKRSLLEFAFHNSDIETSELILEIERHQYTQSYKNLVHNFYLNM